MAMILTFSPAGVVTNPLEVVDFMMAYFFLTQKSQTHFHTNVVTSFQYLLAEYTPETGLASQLEMKLGDYLGTQFTNVQIEVIIGSIDDDENNNEQRITIGCSFNIDGKRQSLGHAVELLGTQVKRIWRLNETGSTT